MPEIATTIHLCTLLGRLYTYDCEVRAALEHDTDRRAAYLAKMEGGLTQKQERLLVLVYQGSRDFAYLRGADEDLYRRVQTFCGEAESELRKERAKSRGRSELQPSVWKYAEQAICKCLATKTEMFGDGWLRKHGLKFSTTDLSSCDGDDAILNELDELHRRGVTLELLRDIWRHYPEEANEMHLPKPPNDAATEEPAEDQQGSGGSAKKGGSPLAPSKTEQGTALPVVAESKELEWADDDEFMFCKDAVAVAKGKISGAVLSKLLTPTGPIRYMRKGQRCKVHVGDFMAYLKTTVGGLSDDEVSDIADELFDDIEKRKAAAHKTKVAGK